MRLSLRSSGWASPRFSFHSRISAASSGLIMIRASDPPMNWRRSRLRTGSPDWTSDKLILMNLILSQRRILKCPYGPIMGLLWHLIAHYGLSQ